MSDGPTKHAPPGAPPLDDIILGDDDQTLAISPRGSAPPAAKHENDALAKAIEGGGADEHPSAYPRDRSSNRVKAAEPVRDAARKPRSKMTLRIPDDEVSRPQMPDSRTPIGGIPSLAATASTPQDRRPPSDPDLRPVRPNRIISVGDRTPDDTLELPQGELAARGAHGSSHQRAAGIDAEQEAGWTPYQPTVADRGDFGGERVKARDDAAAAAARAALMRDPAHTMIDEPGMGAMAMMRQHEPVPPASEDIPIDTDEDEMTADASEETETNPRLPAALDSEEIKIEEGERHTDPGDVPEVDADDLVSVESIPLHHAGQGHQAAHHAGHAPPPLKGGKAPQPAVTATSLMSGFSGHALGVTPIAPAVAARSPSMPAPAPAQSSSRDPEALELELPDPDDAPNLFNTPAAGTPMARRPQPDGGPFGFMPAVGALAPPPMNESAANRKKTRPWWEDLFNDDFIRTMAKITDADISREANFIEESLGCEAGATILDLACGTGRHAVELASRGYQVVGFDLSLAMLARASDEAQDRKQKINFVQGDMREMTFEETFDGVFSWNTSFGYFEDEKNAAVIAKVHRALKKGGQFLLDVVNRDSIIRQAPSLAWFEGDGCICMDEMQIDFITSRMRVKRTLMMDDGRTKEIEYSIRIYSLHELGKLLHDNGFRVAEVSGGTGTPGVFFGCEAPRTLILAEKR